VRITSSLVSQIRRQVYACSSGLSGANERIELSMKFGAATPGWGLSMQLQSVLVDALAICRAWK
jgi:hypothetical protein